MNRLRSKIRRLAGIALALGGLAAASLFLASSAARADLQLCNGTSGRVGIAIGYKDGDGTWTTEGWWNLPPHGCEKLLKGTLVARFYYVYAIDYDNGGEWAGQAFMCTREKEFLIRGIEECLARGYDRTGFYEIDTGQQRTWTVQLTETPQQPNLSTVPTIPILPGRQGPPAGPLFGNPNR